ncbi:hypothetical protein NNO96_17425 [Acinetobacter baumannii]|uniref:hypothetical protein n=1 Tax=Acinetobacter baumannii TaxID=470 RepID=UPI0020CF66DD|nr:hypothetical protein [Acinetobacter baumannii]MCQ1073942.1 hypothetical protein [Acinetobacter baumannii]
MDLLTKLNLTSELDQIANQIAAGDLGLMDRIQKVHRIDEIIALLTGGQEQPPSKGTLAELVMKKQVLGVRLRPQYEFERCVRDYVSAGLEDTAERNAFLHALNTQNPRGSDATYLRDQLAIDLEHGVYIQKNKHGQDIYIGPYLKSDNPFWGMLEWLYENNRLVLGDKALDNPSEDDLFGITGTDDDKQTPDQDFEEEAKAELVNGPADEAGAFYQSIIDGAQIDIELIQKAIEYASEDDTHYLLPKAAEVIKNSILDNLPIETA